MTKVFAFLAGAALVAAGGAYGLSDRTCPFGACCPIVECEVATSGGCCHKADAAASSCCANPCPSCTPSCDGCPLCEVDCSGCCGASTGMAVAGPAALFPPTSPVKAKAEAGCCAVKATAAKASCCPDGPCCPSGPCCTDATKVSAKKPTCCEAGAACCPDGACCGLTAVTGVAALVKAAK